MLLYGTGILVPASSPARAGVARGTYRVDPTTLAALPVGGSRLLQIAPGEVDVRLSVDWSACVPAPLLLNDADVTITRKDTEAGAVTDASATVLRRQWLAPGPVLWLSLQNAQVGIYALAVLATLSDGQEIETVLPPLSCRALPGTGATVEPAVPHGTTGPTAIAASTSSVVLLAANAGRLSATFTAAPDAAGVLYLTKGPTSSLSVWSEYLEPGDEWTLGGEGVYTGVVSGIWDRLGGSVQVTETY